MADRSCRRQAHISHSASGSGRGAKRVVKGKQPWMNRTLLDIPQIKGGQKRRFAPQADSHDSGKNNRAYKLHLTGSSTVLGLNSSSQLSLSADLQVHCSRTTSIRKFIVLTMAAVILERSGVDDLILLDEVEESKVLEVLKSRYLDEQIYTYIGKCCGNCQVCCRLATA